MKNPLDPSTPLPNDEKAEIAVLKACFAETGEAMLLCENCLTPDSFYDHERANLWRVLKAQREQGKPIDLVAILPASTLAGIHPATTAEIYTDKDSAPGNFGHHLRTVLEKQRLRQIFKAGYDAMQAAVDPMADPLIVMSDTKAALELCESSSNETVGVTVKELLMGLVERMQGNEPETAKIATGIEKLDRLTRGGPRRGQMALIGALRHVGKTALARQIALNVGATGKNVLCFFAESSDHEESANTMAVLSGLPTSVFTGDHKTVAKSTVSKMVGVLRRPLPAVRIDTEPNLSVDRIESKCRLLKATKGLDVVFVDYLQFLNSRQSYKGQTREMMLSEDARRLKVLARELDVVLYLLIQLNDEIKPEEAPEMCHVRESRGPINHADIVLLMSAPDGIAHDPTNPNGTHRRMLWNRKWRGVGAFHQAIALSFRGSSQQFLNEPQSTTDHG